MSNQQIRVQRVAGIHQTPTASNAIEASRPVWSPSSPLWSPNCYFSIIRLLMLAGFCLCFCVDARGQFTVEVIQPEVKANEKPYFVMFSGTYCGPCQRWKANELERLNKAGYEITIINVDHDDRWNAKYGVTTVPRFFLLDRKTRKTLRGPWVGYTPAVTLIMNAQGKNLLAPADHSRKVTQR